MSLSMLKPLKSLPIQVGQKKTIIKIQPGRPFCPLVGFFFPFNVISCWRLLFIFPQLAFFPFDIISSQRFFLFVVLSPSAFFPFDIISCRRFRLFSTFFLGQRLVTSTFCPSRRCSIRRLVPFCFFLWTFCPSTPFTVGLFTESVFSLNAVR
jgi:hypothetical protein